MSPEKITQELTLQSTGINGSITASDPLIARSIASTDVDGHKTRKALRTLFVKRKQKHTVNTRNN